MLNDLIRYSAAFLAIAAAFLGVHVKAKAAGKKEAEAESDKQALEDLKRAQQIEQDNSDTDPDDRRERLRDEYSKK